MPLLTRRCREHLDFRGVTREEQQVATEKMEKQRLERDASLMIAAAKRRTAALAGVARSPNRLSEGPSVSGGREHVPSHLSESAQLNRQTDQQAHGSANDDGPSATSGGSSTGERPVPTVPQSEGPHPHASSSVASCSAAAVTEQYGPWDTPRSAGFLRSTALLSDAATQGSMR